MAYPKAEVKAARLALLTFLFFLVVLFNLFWLEVLNGDFYRELSEKNRLRVLYLEPSRGKILDRRGRGLATSRLSFNCTLIPREGKNTIHETLRVLGPVLKEEPDRLEMIFKKNKTSAFGSVILAEDIGFSQAMAVEEMLDSLPGVMVETRPQREYPYAEVAAHLVGYTGPRTDEEEEENEEDAYRSSDWVGIDGVEKSYEDYLRGRPGGIQMEVNSRGRFLRALGMRQPREGRDITLTIDAELQKGVQGLLRDKKASVIVMELKDGGILCLNSAPSYNNNLFASFRGRRDVGKFLAGPHAPMVNRGIRGQYPPGSVFKIVTAMAGLENGKLKTSASYRCPGFMLLGGQRFGCWFSPGHGDQGLTEAFAHSCDVFFYLAGLSAGGEALVSKALEFGFSQKTGIDVPGERKGFVPSREWKRKKLGQGWYDGDTANLAIGQGYLEVTPLQALVMVGVVATGGERLVPHVLDKIDGTKVSERHGTRVRMTAESLEAVKKGLDAVVNMDTGTGRLARYPGLRVAGKTGTAQSGQAEDHAWFVGYAPAENPKVAMVVFIENGGHGGVAAAGVAHEVWKFLKEAHYV